jgi:hypothetical protein
LALVIGDAARDDTVRVWSVRQCRFEGRGIPPVLMARLDVVLTGRLDVVMSVINQMRCVFRPGVMGHHHRAASRLTHKPDD